MSSQDDARKNLRAFLEDMSALQKWADPGNQDHTEFVNAFKVARHRAREAAREYVKAFLPEPGLPPQGNS